jgi:hypothetical protein
LIYEEILLYHFPEKQREYERKKAVFERELQDSQPATEEEATQEATNDSGDEDR